MTLLVTLDEAKSHLRVDHGFDDDDITLKIEAASAAVLEYIGDTQYLFLDTGGDDLDLEDTTADQVGLRARHRARQATLLLIGDWFANREPTASDTVDPRFGYGYLPRSVIALLYTMRDPTIA